jgi:hypothetical protein
MTLPQILAALRKKVDANDFSEADVDSILDALEMAIEQRDELHIHANELHLRSDQEIVDWNTQLADILEGR